MKIWFGLVGILAVAGLSLWGLEVEPFRPWCAASFISVGVWGALMASTRRQHGWFHVVRRNGVIVGSPAQSLAVAAFNISTGIRGALQIDGISSVAIVLFLAVFVLDRWNLKRTSPTPRASWLF